MMKHRLLVEKDKDNTYRKNQEKRAFFWRVFLEVSVFTALTVGYHHLKSQKQYARSFLNQFIFEA
jgi:hypothetical protein